MSAAEELARLAGPPVLEGEAEHHSSGSGYRIYVANEIERAAKQLDLIRKRSVLLRDPCGG